MARPYCCPGTVSLVLLTLLKYMIIICAILSLPVMLHTLILNKSLSEELHDLHLDAEGFRDLPAFVRRNYIVCSATLVILFCWIFSLIPHDFRDKQRRRHMVREIAAAQFTLSGPLCCRRSRMRLFFGTYPNQARLDMVGTLGLQRSAGPIPPAQISTESLGVGTPLALCTLALTAITAVDTTFAWLDRSLALSHAQTMQDFCFQTGADGNQCTRIKCEDFALGKDISNNFCSEVRIYNDATTCSSYGRSPPCCGGCITGASLAHKDEGPLSFFKVVVSLFADIATLTMAFLAVKYALNLASITDHIDIYIMRRSRTRFKSKLANFALSVPLALDFLEHTFQKARQSDSTRSGDGFVAPESTRWGGARNFELDAEPEDWDQFFERDLRTPPASRWTSKFKVPKRCLGISEDEKVLAAWLEMPLIPPAMTMTDFVLGGFWHVLFPLGKTHHGVVVTDRRLFYMRHKRPLLPLPMLLTDLRVDVFRHDHDIFYGRMERTKIPSVQRLVHAKLLLEEWLPGRVYVQNRFGVLELNRRHGDIGDVYKVVSQLTRVSHKFIDKTRFKAAGLHWDNCQAVVGKQMTKKSNNLWSVNPQPDDAVEPSPEIQLHSAEDLVYSLSVKNIGTVWSKYYRNVDIIITTGRIHVWSRCCYKQFDCAMLHYWCCCWAACLNPLFPAKNLQNSVEFVSMPVLLSFSTDLTVEPPLWHIPHRTPLQCPCIETCCAMLTRLVARDARGINKYNMSIIPRRSKPIAELSLIWRLKPSAHAKADMLMLHSIKPHFLNRTAEEIQDLFTELGLSSEDATAKQNCLLHEQDDDDDDRVETLRRIMAVVQDQRHAILDKIDGLA